jgi:simple sugar transport system ATP-binding protein
MRKGAKIATVDAVNTSKDLLAQMMVGRAVLFSSQRNEQIPGEVVFHTENLSYRDGNLRTRLENVSFSVRAGEIVGIAGVEGNGQLELVNCIMGMSKPFQGTIVVNKRDLTNAEILERRRYISFVSQDRSKMGASVKDSIVDNVRMTHHRLNPKFTRWKGLLLNNVYSHQFTAQIEKNFAVVMGSADNEFRSLSGGNQQKVILGRELLLDTPFVLLDQPTRGLDVGSIEYVHETILKMREQKRAILLISADLEELFRIADRILVIFRGRIAANLPVDQTNIEQIGYLMLEGREKINAAKTN